MAERDIGAEVFFVGGNPIGRNVVLGGFEIYVAAADTLVQVVLQFVFHVGIPRGVVAGLGPQIADVVSAAEAGRDEMVHFVIACRNAANSVFLEHSLLDASRNREIDIVVVRCADFGDGDRASGSGRKSAIGEHCIAMRHGGWVARCADVRRATDQ